ncbi:DUF4446 family protein [Clostridium sp. Marseille-QA1073]
MDRIINFISEYQLYITLGLMALVTLLIILLINAFISLNKVEKKYRRMMRGVNNKNLEELLLSYLDSIDDIKEKNDEVIKICNTTKALTESCIQKVAIIRYKAFENIGSDLSYSVAFLDANNNGVLLTSIYGRNESTTYAKPIDKGISRYDLSEEEERVLHQAMNTKI